MSSNGMRKYCSDRTCGRWYNRWLSYERANQIWCRNFRCGPKLWIQKKVGRPKSDVPGLTPTEVKAAKKLQAEGWTVYRNGWPDFFAVRGGKARLIEVKRTDDYIRAEQFQMHQLLKEYFNIDVEVIVPDAPNWKVPAGVNDLFRELEEVRARHAKNKN